MARFFQQLKALLWRNVLLKSRKKAQLFQELFFPIFFVALLALIKAMVEQDTKESRTFPAYDINSTDFGKPLTNKTLIYAAPNTSQYNQWMQDIVSGLEGPPQYEMFDSVADAETAYKKNFKNVAFGVIFNHGGDPNAYAIRTDWEKIPSSEDIFDFRGGACRIESNGTSSENCGVNKYMTSGFVKLQLAIENVLMTNLGVSTIVLSSRKTQVQMMDLDEFDPDSSYIQISSSIYFVFSFCILASYLAINVVAEKEKKIKDGMLMMGLNSNVFWLSWSIIYMGMVVFSSLIMILIIVATTFFTQSSLILLFLIFLLYGASFIALGFMITPFFNKARVAGAVAGFSTVFISLLYLIVTETRDKRSFDSTLPVWSQWLMCLLAPLAFATCMDEAVYLDINMDGFHFDESLTYGKFPLYAPMTMLLVDTIIYGLLTVYFDKVIPGEYGVSHKPYFFLQRSYWFSSKSGSENEHLVASSHRTLSQSEDVEAVPANMENNLALKISSICKSFKFDKKVTNAVDDFSLDIYEGHITCLLGHNGAGKTTLMNILTGVTLPTSGNALIMGRDITVASEMEMIRKSCGICPQHNILYDSLSCKEHLRIFADIKGIPPNLREIKVHQALKDVDLENQADTFGKDLSGGQKRKLSVAIALIGDPKLIFLDEPTAGMDPYSRRHLWSLLQKRKEGRVILLTTHFMDEADILSDRKAFLQNGKLRCCGSSLFLKNKFGIGYHLSMVVEPNCDVAPVTSFLTSVIPAVKHQRTHGKEVSYTVPRSELSKFSALFGQLEEKLDILGIKSYGVSMTTLEEVFLKLEGAEQMENGSGAQEDNCLHYPEINEETNILHHGDVEVMNGDYHKTDKSAISINSSKVEVAPFACDLISDEKELQKQHYLTLLRIRFLSVIRNKKALFFQTFLPVCLVVAGLVIIKVRSVELFPVPKALPIYLNYYVKSSVGGASPMLLPGLLAFDSVDTNASHALLSGWKQRYSVDTIATNVTPHFVGIQMNGMKEQFLTDFVALYNNTALHSIPAALSLVTQSLLMASNISAYINVSSYPWPKIEHTFDYDMNTNTAGMLIGLAFVLIIPGFSAEVVRDRELKLRGQLRISGVSFNVYWGTIYTVNFLIYLVPTLLIIIMTLAIEIPGLNSGDAIVAMLLLFLCNIPFFCFFALVVSFIFNRADNCTAYLPFMLNVVAILPYIAVTVVDMLDDSNIAIILHYIFCVIDPPYIILGGFYFIARINLFSTAHSDKQLSSTSYFDLYNHTIIAICMPIIHIIWMYWLLRVLDVVSTGGKVREAFPCFSKSYRFTTVPNTDTIEEEDSDVMDERSRIDALKSHVTERYAPSIDMMEMNVKEPAAYTKQLRKTFVKREERKTCTKPGVKKTKVAVRNLTLGVNEGEVLGLLGPNGAGKTTALNMIIAETEPTCGKVMVGGQDIRLSMLSMAFLGYCPQHDALWDGITLKEHIVCFAEVKGMPSKEAEKLVDFYVSNMKLEDHKLKQAKTLSGGTRRKLSYILSILGNPDLVLLDEPSTGMDPQSKRFLWDTISSTFRNTNKGAILTTHYMEEADALCSRVGIMVNGQLQCLGSTQHLKDKFGSGYILEVKLSYNQSSEIEDFMDRLENHLKELFPNLYKVERFMERAQYAIPKENVKSLGHTFASLEECKQSHQLEEYNFSQSSLEQVFLHFAKKQVNEMEDDQEDAAVNETSLLSPQSI